MEGNDVESDVAEFFLGRFSAEVFVALFVDCLNVDAARLLMTQSNALELARVAFFDGVTHFEAQRLSQAYAAFSLALTYAPGRPSILLNQGITLVRLNRFEEAIPILEAALDSEKESADGWAALALALSELSLWSQCGQVCERLFALGVHQPSLHLLHARCLANGGLVDEAKVACEKALVLDKQSAQAWFQLADFQRDQGDTKNAIANYQQALLYGADAELVNYMLSSLGRTTKVLQPPRAYVQNLFDQYAHDFEQHLVGQLGYCGHSVLVEQLPPNCPTRFPSVLDLGCGTGLCAPLLRLKSERLFGVDLSPAMIEKSRQTKLYDVLTVNDVRDYLAHEVTKFDFVVAADVLIYVGELERLFTLLSQRMVAGGWFAFTVENSIDGSDVQLFTSLRYGHSADYIRALAVRHNFGIERKVDAPIRVHDGVPLLGQYWYLRYGLEG
jgi:predicted TPR repeat methyltransferase